MPLNHYPRVSIIIVSINRAKPCFHESPVISGDLRITYSKSPIPLLRSTLASFKIEALALKPIE